MDFWELHRRLGELHQAELDAVRLKVTDSPQADADLSLDAEDPLPLAIGLRQEESTATSRNSSKVRFAHEATVRPPSGPPPSPPLHPCSLEGADVSEDSPWKKKLRSEVMMHQNSNGQLHFALRSLWIESKDDESPRLQKRVSCTLPSMTDEKVLAEVEEYSESQSLLWMLQHPAARFRMCWVALGLLMLAHDVVTIPLRVFGIEESIAMRVISWIVRVYWSLDIFLSFFVGFYDSGRLVVKLERTVKHYLTSWFLLDITVVCLDWVFLILESVGDGVDGVPRLSKTVRIFRLARLARLGRLLKVRSLTSAIEEYFSSETASIYYSMIKISLWLLVMNHVIACIWFGMTSVEDEQNWVLANQLDGRSGLYQYATSLHWSIAQLGVGQTEIEAVSLMERTFSICVMLGALLSFSTLVSSMTSLMQRLDHLKTDEVAQFKSLRRFLTENNISEELCQRVTRFLQYSFEQKRSVQAADQNPPLLEMLSKPLQRELQLERHRECLLQSAFFSSMLHSGSETFAFAHFNVLRDLAVSALCHAVVAKGDVVFAAGSVDAGPSTGGAGGAVGDLVSRETSRLISLELDAFCNCLGKTPEMREMARAHGEEYVAKVNALEEAELSDLWDEEAKGAEFEPISGAFEQAGRELTPRTGFRQHWGKITSL
ncbi:Potassium voltage-gated channel subfamily H member 6 (Ether-a-go-go-related gene potassium channel 2) (ERG-2) (Eag-related protein 2) (Ether-a-go-go-related protein 2) (hERG-2) (hERG2) (Voltage-gated potassium channel subunit Kv11.2) [Durusdinium trenchii]|uniref:Uncharacterized protein n=1 Tax=Durusdinium trenchii TaxID=1381693 RepID=A0ABP0JDE8_9DINO